MGALADQGLVASSGFLLTVLLGRWLPPEQYGTYALAFSIFLFFAGLHQALLLEPMSVFGPGVYRDSLPEYLGELFRLHLCLTTLLSLLLGLGIGIFGRWFHNVSLNKAMLGAGLGMPCILLFWLWRRAAYLEPKPWLGVSAAGAYALTLLGLVLLFRRMGWLSAFVAFLLQMVAACVAIALLLFLVRPRVRAPNWKLWLPATLKRHWEYGQWAIATAVVYWISNGAYFVIVGVLLRMEDVASLRALQNLAVPLPQFITAMSLFLLPQASAMFAQQQVTSFRRNARRTIMLFAGAGVLYMLVVVLLGARLLEHIYAGRYAELAWLIPLLALPIPLMSASQGLAIALRAMQAPQEILKGYGVAGLLTIFVGLALIRWRGLAGALLCILISYVGFTLVLALRYRIRLKQICSPASEVKIATPAHGATAPADLRRFEVPFRQQD